MSVSVLNKRHPNRLFAIGCSYTSYKWRTYADFLGEHFSSYHNLGTPGAGNVYIATTLTEAIQKFDMGPQDRVVLQWSNYAREDRYIQFKSKTHTYTDWQCSGSVHANDFFDQEFIDKYTTMEHFVKRDLAYIYMTHCTLRYLKIPFYALSVQSMKPCDHVISKKLMELQIEYGDVIDEINESLKKSIWKDQWPTNGDTHPTETQHQSYLHSHLAHLIRNEF
tara:strand:- start:1561 stop:2226 length:666 start_codon:yes stop_codon:yes gene_type:complete